MVDAAIVVDNVSKSFRLANDPMRSLKERVLGLGRKGHQEFVALRDVNVTVNRGETLGVLGHNGSGKSTLLKCIAGILPPTAGQIQTRGRLASLLELGAGFHPELTGRENVFINASFLGISKRNIARRFGEIVDFAELEQFIDEPVKHYSSGMYVRLGFAVAVNVDPDILLVDEVLAVGDERFQRKCIEKIRRFQQEGRTILLVTHSAETVRQICDRAVVLHHGDLVANGKPAEAISEFRARLANERGGEVPKEHDGHPAPTLIGAPTVRSPDGTTVMTIRTGDSVQFRFDVEADVAVADAVVEVELKDRDGRMLHTTASSPFRLSGGPMSVTMDLEHVPLVDGEYPISIRLLETISGRLVDWRDQLDTLFIRNGPARDGLVAIPATLTVTNPEGDAVATSTTATAGVTAPTAL